jgi:hypothetical protein
VQVGVGSHTLIMSALRSRPIGSGRSRRTIAHRCAPARSPVLCAVIR